MSPLPGALDGRSPQPAMEAGGAFKPGDAGKPGEAEAACISSTIDEGGVRTACPG